MAQIKLRFITQWGPVSFIIRKFMWSQFSHVEFVVPTGYLGAREMGVRIRGFDYCKPKREALGIIECSDEVADKVLAFARAQIGRPYDFISVLFGFPFRLDLGSRKNHRWFCSELVAVSFEQAGYPLVERRNKDRITPEDLFQSPLVQIKEKCFESINNDRPA
jgi:uncharacterized protein YycO